MGATFGTLLVLGTPGMNPFMEFYRQFKRQADEEKVPAKNQTEVLREIEQRIKLLGYWVTETADQPAETPGPVTVPSQPAVPPEPAAARSDLDDLIDNLDDDCFSLGVGDTHLDTETALPTEKSVWHKTLEEVLDKWRATWDVGRKFPFLWLPVQIEGQRYWVISTFRIRGDAYEWNLSGIPDWNQHPPLHRCDETVLVHHNGKRVVLNRDFEDRILFPASWDKSNVKGTLQNVRIAVFLWLVKDQPGREIRFWVNENPIGQKAAPGQFGDIHTWRKAMRVK